MYAPSIHHISRIRGYMLRRGAILAAVLFWFYSSVQLAHGHGYLKSPISRNYAARLNNKFYCEHCGQGNGQLPDVCGNPFQGPPGVNFTDPSLWFDGFKATWTSGQEVDITIFLSTNHGGRMAVRLCPQDRFGMYASCFNEPANQLRRVSADPKYDGKVYWYLTPSDTEITQRFRLPAGVSCTNGCVLQWWWVAYQHCYFPCLNLADDVEGECGKSFNGAGQCSPPFTQTEQFNNCADVLILPPSGTTPPPPSPSPRPSPPPQSSPPPPRPSPPSPRPSSPSPPSPSPKPPAPPPPSPQPPPPSPQPSPPAPPPSTAATCPPLEWKCSECSRLASTSATRLGTGLEPPCLQCAAVAADPWSCHNCFATAPNKEVLLGCLACARDGAGSGCSMVCAARALDAAAMGSCADCSRRGGNAWDCGPCFDKSGGDVLKRDACLRCVGDRAGAWSCGECSARYGSVCEVSRCADCLRSGADAWGCITATTYAAACSSSSGRRLALGA